MEIKWMFVALLVGGFAVGAFTMNKKGRVYQAINTTACLAALAALLVLAINFGQIRSAQIRCYESAGVDCPKASLFQKK